MRPRLIALLKEGKRVALISDAGMPLISDPGYKLVAQCAAENIPMTCIPGPTATTTALVLSACRRCRRLRVFCRPKSAARRGAFGRSQSRLLRLIFTKLARVSWRALRDMQANPRRPPPLPLRVNLPRSLRKCSAAHFLL